MEHVFHCRVEACGHSEAWTTEEAAQAAAVVHVHDEHHDLWVHLQGRDKPKPKTPPNAYGRRYETWERQSV